MGMFSYVEGIIPTDEKFNQMKEVWNACEQANVQVPDEVRSFFRGDVPDPSGVVVSLGGSSGVSEYREDMREGFEVDLREIPDHVKIIRFVNSY